MHGHATDARCWSVHLLVSAAAITRTPDLLDRSREQYYPATLRRRATDLRHQSITPAAAASATAAAAVPADGVASTESAPMDSRVISGFSSNWYDGPKASPGVPFGAGGVDRGAGGPAGGLPPGLLSPFGPGVSMSGALSSVSLLTVGMLSKMSVRVCCSGSCSPRQSSCGHVHVSGDVAIVMSSRRMHTYVCLCGERTELQRVHVGEH